MLSKRRIVLNSSASLNNYPLNNASYFAVNLPQRAIFNEKYMIGLSEIIYPRIIYNVRNQDSADKSLKKNEVQICQAIKPDVNGVKLSSDADFWKIVHKFEIAEGYYPDYKHILNIINKELDTFPVDPDENLVQHMYSQATIDAAKTPEQKQALLDSNKKKEH